jgi:hypothetical protein
MSRSPDYDTPVESMTDDDLYENAMAIYKSELFEMDRLGLMAENIRLGVESKFTIKKTSKNLVYILITEHSGIPEIGMISTDEAKVKKLWNDLVMDENGNDRECDMTNLMASTSYERGYFMWHKDEYRIAVEEVV